MKKLREHQVTQSDIAALKHSVAELRETTKTLNAAVNELLQLRWQLKRQIGVRSAAPRIVKTSVLIEDVIREVAREFDLLEPMFFARSQCQEVVMGRYVSFYIATRLTLHSAASVGRRFDMHHTNVLHGIAKIRLMMVNDEVLATRVRRVENRLRELIYLPEVPKDAGIESADAVAGPAGVC